MKAHFEMMAAYNAWANGRVYDAAAALGEQDWRRDVGVFFGSLMGTLNHLFVTDMHWMSRFRGERAPDWALDQIVYAGLADLAPQRTALDRDIQAHVYDLTEQALCTEFRYRRVTTPELQVQRRDDALSHLFSHQIHHRGQAHACLTRLTGDAPALDLLYFQRGG